MTAEWDDDLFQQGKLERPAGGITDNITIDDAGYFGPAEPDLHLPVCDGCGRSWHDQGDVTAAVSPPDEEKPDPSSQWLGALDWLPGFNG